MNTSDGGTNRQWQRASCRHGRLLPTIRGCRTRRSLTRRLAVASVGTVLLMSGRLKANVVEPVCEAGYSNGDDCREAQVPQRNEVNEPTQRVGARLETDEAHADNSLCGLYLAPSTIPGAGLGLFTAVAKQVGDVIGPRQGGDGCIPLVDWLWHNAQRTSLDTPRPDYTSHPLDPFTNYLWNGHTMGMHTETSRGDVEALCPGLDCAINCHLALNNVGQSFPVYDDGSVGGPEDPTARRHGDHIRPGAGAYSPYWNSTSYVVRDIPAGGELFKQYGDNWFVVRHHVFGNIPLTNDYLEATRLLSQLSGFMVGATQDESNSRRSNSAQLLDNIVARDLFESVLLPIKDRFDSRTLNALPNRWSDVVVAIQAKDVTVTLQPQHTVSLDYLQTQGVCMDHITVQHSTVPHAGHGAFAARTLPAGTVIAVSPLFHVLDTAMNMYNFTSKAATASAHHTVPPRERQRRQQQAQDWIRLVDEVDRTQLLLNYCYGHGDSSLLLCPYGSGVNYMNHHRANNVRIAWATDGAMGHNDTLVKEASIPELLAIPRPQLAFQYVATRDIPAGDELFLDYGVEWEQAWLAHVAQYPLTSNDTPGRVYVSAHAWNWEFNEASIRTERQQQMDPYPDHLQMRCHRTLLMRPPPTIDDAGRVLYQWSDKEYGVPCRILDRFWDGGSGERHARIELYTVQLEWITQSEATDSEESAKTVTWVERTDVPRSAIRFFDVPTTTDLHQAFAFRHRIGIPDNIIPMQWRHLQ